jgi:hypothetical protein
MRDLERTPDPHPINHVVEFRIVADRGFRVTIDRDPARVFVAADRVVFDRIYVGERAVAAVETGKPSERLQVIEAFRRVGADEIPGASDGDSPQNSPCFTVGL